MSEWLAGILGGLIGSALTKLADLFISRRDAARRALRVILSDFGHVHSSLTTWLELPEARSRSGPRIPEVRAVQTLGGDLGHLPQDIQDKVRSFELLLRGLDEESRATNALVEREDQVTVANLLHRADTESKPLALRRRHVEVVARELEEFLGEVEAALEKTGYVAAHSPV